MSTSESLSLLYEVKPIKNVSKLLKTCQIFKKIVAVKKTRQNIAAHQAEWRKTAQPQNIFRILLSVTNEQQLILVLLSSKAVRLRACEAARRGRAVGQLWANRQHLLNLLDTDLIQFLTYPKVVNSSASQ